MAEIIDFARVQRVNAFLDGPLKALFDEYFAFLEKLRERPDFQALWHGEAIPPGPDALRQRLLRKHAMACAHTAEELGLPDFAEICWTIAV